MTKAGLSGLSSAPLLVGIAAVGLLASPVKAAPALTRTFTGFTDAFQPTAWDPLQQGTATGTQDATTMTFAVPQTAGTSYTFTFDTTKLDGTLNTVPPAEAANYKFKSGVATFNWTWNFTAGDLGALYPFSTVIGLNSTSLTVPTGGNLFDVSGYVNSGTGTTLAVNSPTSFGFKLASNGGLTPNGATASLTNFSFVATYEAVPGPLPVAGAVGGFLWSRKLRRRLKLARTTA